MFDSNARLGGHGAGPTIWRVFGLLVALIAAVSHVSEAAQYFKAPYVPYPTAVGPVALATPDLNGDGVPDLVTVNGGAYSDYVGTVSVFLGTPHGLPGSRTDYAVGSYTLLSGMAVGDLDGDGRLDLVLSHGNPNIATSTYSLLMGRAGGTFGPSVDVDYGMLGPASSATLADLNHDGRLDLILTHHVTGIASVMLGHGDGAFGPRTDYAAGDFPSAVLVADVDRDGTPDVLVLSRNSRNLYVFPGHGDGTLGTAIVVAAGNSPNSFALADLDGDGKLDLAVTQWYGYPVGSVATLLGHGDGTFGTPTYDPVGRAPSAVATADVDGNGTIDLVVTNGGDSGQEDHTVSVLLGFGNGTFALGYPGYECGSSPNDVAIVDLEQNGTADIVVTNGTSSQVSVLLGTAGGFGTPSYPTAGTPEGLAVSDLDGDGVPDLAVVGNSLGSPGRVSIFGGTGIGTFRTRRDFETAGYEYGVAIGDLNGDGRPDLVVPNTGSVHGFTVLFNTGGLNFANAVDVPAMASPSAIAIGDVNGDGKPDLVGNCYGFVAALLGNGDGTFQGAVQTPITRNTRSFGLADLDGDGALDVVLMDSGEAYYGHGTVSVLKGNGDGTFQAPRDYTTEIGANAVAIADLDGDGRADLAVACTGGDTGQPRVCIFLGTGGGTFATGARFDVGVYPVAIAALDVDQDGVMDLAVANAGSSTISVLRGAGGGSFGGRVDHGAGSPSGLAVGDLNRDGRPDLVVTERTSNAVVALLNTTATASVTIVASAGPHGTIEPSGDVTVPRGSSMPFEIVPEDCYRVADVVVDGASQGAVASYVFVDVAASHSIVASFAPLTRTIRTTAGAHGTISPAGPVAVGCGSDASFTVRPDACAHVLDVQVDGLSVGPVTAYAFTNVTQNHRLVASFALDAFTVSVSAGPHGAVSPNGTPSFDCGSSPAFTMTPDAHYHVADVVVDGASVGAVATYTFTNLHASHTLAASFAIETHVLAIALLGQGIVTPVPDLARYDDGATVELTAAASAGWVFAGWSGAASGTDPVAQVVMDADKSVTAEFRLLVGFDLKPHDLHLNAKGPWVTGYVTPPPPYDAAAVDVASVRLNGVVSAATDPAPKLEEHGKRLKLKFARAAVTATLTAGNAVPVTLTGRVGDAGFVGTDVIEVRAPKVHHPHAGDALIAGSRAAVSWDADASAPMVTVLSSHDDGATWILEANGVPNTGSFDWTVPAVPTDRARVQVSTIYDVDETGVIPEAELAASDSFSIVSPTDAPSTRAEFGLRVVNPLHGRGSLRYGLATGEPARLAVYDIGGRQVTAQGLESAGPGWHELALGTLPPGMYVLRLSQGGRSVSARIVVLR